MNNKLDSESNLLKRSVDQITFDKSKDCSFCKQPINIVNQVEYENNYCKTSLTSSDENNDEFYYSLVLIKEKVNIYRLKRFIIKYQIYLRQIIIQHCQFYLSQRDLENNITVGPIRMLLEIDFKYMFEMFHFQDITIIDIDVCNIDLLKGTTYSVDNNNTNSKIVTQKTTKVASVDRNNQKMTKEQKLLQYKYQQLFIINSYLLSFLYCKQSYEKVSKMYSFCKKISFYERDIFEYIKINKHIQNMNNILNQFFQNILFQNREFSFEFDCDNCKMIEYEYGNEKQQIYQEMIENRKESEQKMINKLKWGDYLDKDKFGQVLLNNFMQEIKYHLETYKKYTKYAFNEGKLLILGDVLKNPFSLTQLQNLIQINLQQINGIIFKDNQSIPQRVFSQLMQYFLKVPSLKMISFISSVLSKQNLNDLLYLIKQKQVEFLVLHKSYFLRKELSQIIRIKEEKFIINHFRYYIIQMQFNKIYEFTPFSFSYDILVTKQYCDLLDVEMVYLNQQNYPNKIKSLISFFQGKNLSILHNNVSSKILLQITYAITGKLIYSQSQIQKLVEQLIQTDDINVIVLQILKEFGKEVTNQLLAMMSYLSTIEVFSDQIEKIKNPQQWQLFAESFLSGFSKFKQKDIKFFIIESIKNSHIRGYNIQYYQYKYPKNQLFSGNNNRYQNGEIEDMYVDINKHKESYSFERNILQTCKNLNSLELRQYSIDERINDIQFDNACSQIKKLGLFKIEQIQLCKDILAKCTNLKVLYFYEIIFDFENFNKNDKFFQTIEELEFRRCKFNNQLFLNQFLQSTTQLRVLKLEHYDFQYKCLDFQNIQTSIEVLSLPPSLTSLSYINFYSYIFNNLKNLKELDLQYNNDDYEQNSVNLQQLNSIKIILPSLIKIQLGNLETRMVLLLKWILKSSPNLTFISLSQNSEDNIDFDQFKILDLSNITKLSYTFLNDPQYLTIIEYFKNLETLKIKDSSFSKDLYFNNISKKLTKISLIRCKQLNAQFIQLVMEECRDLKYLELIGNEVLLNASYKLDFTKMKIQDLEKFKFQENKGFQSHDFLSNLLATQSNLKQIMIEDNLFNREINISEIKNFVNILKENKKLEELFIEPPIDHHELCYLIEKIGDFFDIANFNIKNSWDDEILQNKEINFFNVSDSQNITLYQQIRKQSELFDFKYSFLNQQSSTITLNHTNDNLDKYCKYPPIYFYNTFKTTTDLNNYNRNNQDQQNFEFKNGLVIQKNPFQNLIDHSHLQILELNNIYITNQILINCLQKQQQLTDIKLIKLKFSFLLERTQNLILNDILLRSLSLRKLAIQDSFGISHLLVNILIENQQIELLQLQVEFMEELDFNSISPKLKILDIQCPKKFKPMNFLENIFGQCKQLQLIRLKEFQIQNMSMISFENNLLIQYISILNPLF